MSEAITRNLDHLRPWMPWVAHEPASEEQRLELIESWNQAWRDGGDSAFGIFFDGRVIGGTGLHRRVGPGGIEIGYWIDVDHIREGYATEIAAALTDAAFEQPGINRVEILHDKANTTSAGVPRRIGFTMVEEGAREREAPADSGIEWRWVVTKTDWLSR